MLTSWHVNLDWTSSLQHSPVLQSTPRPLSFGLHRRNQHMNFISTFWLLRQGAEVACAPVLGEKSGGKRVWGSHFPPANMGLAMRSRRMNAFEKCSLLGHRPELRNRFQLLEGRRECVRQAPHRSRCELLVLGIEVATMHCSSQVSRYLQIPLDESAIDDEFRCFIRKVACPPSLDLPAHRLEVALHAVDANCENVDEAQVFGVFGEHRRKAGVESQTRLRVYRNSDETDVEDPSQPAQQGSMMSFKHR